MKKSFAELESDGLRWVKARGRRYELRSADDEVLGSITRTSAWTSRAEVEAPGNHWIFQRKGVFRQKVIIRSVGTGDEPAEYIYHSTKGRLVYPDGRVFLWKQGNFWGTKWVWTTEDGEPLIGFQTSGFFKTQGEINLNADAADDKVPSLLIFLGWYLYTLYEEDASAAAAVVAST
jgi:hypothetical protein